MQRKLLAATVAAGPLLALAFAAAPLAALAQTNITTSTTTPLQTSTVATGVPGNVVVETAGSINSTVAGPLITLNSNNTVVTAGSLSTSEVNDSTGVLIKGGNTGSFINSGSISIISSLNPPDDNNDGNADGPFASGQNRFGVRLIGPGTFTGNISLAAGGSVLASGNDTAAISIETGLIGDFLQSGTINATGDRVYGIHLAAPLTGNARITGTIAGYGLNAVGVALDGDVSGAAVIQGSVSATGFRYQSRPVLDTDRATLGPDDLLTGGPAIRVTANLNRGLLFDTPPPISATDDGTQDADADGTPDSLEGTAAVTAYGSAPAVLIGSSTKAITLGAIGTGDYSFGLYNRGSIQADGVYDGFAPAAIQIGTSSGQAVNIAQGFSNSGAISANAYQANATGLSLLSGAIVPTILNTGSISVSVTSDLTNTVRGLSIQKGATVNSLTNRGQIIASATGTKTNVVAFEDLNGGVIRIDNTGQISAGIVNTSNTPTTGKQTAIDVSANTSGVTLHQEGVRSTTLFTDTDGDGINDSEEPQIYGDVKFGSGNDRLELANGTLSGAVSFGAGADTLAISGGGALIGSVTDSDGKLSINLGKGTLALQNAQTINATSLNVTSSDAVLLFSADPTANSATKLVLSSASLAANTQLGMTLKSILDTPTRYTVIQANTLSSTTFTSSLTGAPYLYIASASANNSLGQLYIDVRPRTAAEFGFNQTQAGAYNAVIQALKTDSALAAPLLVQASRNGLVQLYDQLLPDLGHGTFDALTYANQQLAEGIAHRPDLYDRYGPDTFWGQEVNGLVRTETGNTMGSDTQVFGFAGGYEAMGEYGGALGVAVSYLNLQERDNAAQVGEQTGTAALQGDVYWRRSTGGWRMSLGGGGGYAWMKGQRAFFSGDLNGDGLNDLQRNNIARWNGIEGHAFGSLAYEATMGHFFLRPEARFDYLYLNEGERKESGGGTGFDVTTASRASSALNAQAAVAFGASFGRDLWWRPEIRLGYREQVAGTIGSTVAHFSTGTPFTLASADTKDGAITLDMALRAGTPMSYVALEGGVAAAKKTKRYNLRLAGRMMF